MEPLKPETKNAIMDNNPQADPADIAEYERLLSERFTIDPDLPRSPSESLEESAKEARLNELFNKLFSS